MYVFIILHYLAEKMTRECVAALEKNFDMKQCRVVIVDNASANGSGQRLADYYKDTDWCHVILNKQNLGFANGNNVGYQYARKMYHPDHMIVMNNDVLIEDPDFLRKIDDIYSRTGFYVCGPDILSVKTNIHQSPVDPMSQEYVNSLIQLFSRRVKHPYFCYWYEHVKDKVRLRTRLRALAGKPVPKPVHVFVQEERRNVVLHGACLIFSRNWIEKEDQAFDPATFLFYEEEILWNDCQNKGYLMVYEPSIHVKHFEDVSTNESVKAEKKNGEFRKYCFINQNQLASLKILKSKMYQ